MGGRRASKIIVSYKLLRIIPAKFMQYIVFVETTSLSIQEASEALLHGYSTEELSQEMANLEGLMKDLSAITANQFNC